MGEVSGQALPVDTLRDAIPQLRRPFAPEAIRFKVQATWPKGNPHSCIVVGYIDARLVVERLNAVCPDAWSATVAPLENSKLAVCRLTLFGVTREDVGESPKGLSKDLYSDALKRAAVHFGVGVSVYALPQITLTMAANRSSLEARGQGDRKTLVLTEQGHVNMRAGYRKWLEEHGRNRFGEELEHGDVEGQVLDPEAEAEEFVPEKPPAVTDEKGEALIEECRSSYAALAEMGDGVGRHEIPPGTFNGWLTGAWHSHEELERLRDHLDARRGQLAERFEAVTA